MRKALQVVCALIFLSLAAYSRGQSSSLEDNIADSLVITYDTGPEIRANDLLEFWIKNTSNYCLVFPIDFGLQLYVKQGSDWKAIGNSVEYKGQPGQEALHLKPAGDASSEKTTVAKPDLSDLNLTGRTKFRATITGRLCDDESVVIEKQIPFVVRP